MQIKFYFYFSAFGFEKVKYILPFFEEKDGQEGGINYQVLEKYSSQKVSCCLSLKRMSL